MVCIEPWLYLGFSSLIGPFSHPFGKVKEGFKPSERTHQSV